LKSKLFIHATNIHQGGGCTLLNALLKALPDTSEVFVLLDRRMPMPEGVPESVQIRWVKPSVIERLKAERWIADNVRPRDVVLCFGNLPLLFKVQGRIMVFLQNRYLIDNVSLGDLPFKTKVKLIIERLWLLVRMRNVDGFIVQSPTMKRLLLAFRREKQSVPIMVLPFMDKPKGYTRKYIHATSKKSQNCDFLYVATGGAHKNHRRLIEAWCLLAEEGLFPSLRLTLEESQDQILCFDIEEMRQRHGLKITNEGTLSHFEILALYNKVDALIFPSTFESFGLPLIEARQAGLRVLASEMDYVRDVLDPDQTFDPQSTVSIARAVKRFMGVDEHPLPLIDAKGFLSHLFGKLE
jgi:glycosyltransferase involved in cell wall biosynthesis